jgi:hypothetical protein
LEETLLGGGGSFQLNATDSFVNLKRGVISLSQDEIAKLWHRSDGIASWINYKRIIDLPDVSVGQ